MRRLRTACAAVTLTLAAVTGCTSGGTGGGGARDGGGDAASEPVASRSVVEEYVALGDSYTAGPFIPVTDLAGGCFRSSGNYPALLAARLDAALTDVSCSAADTDDLRRPQRTLGGGRVPAQVDALGRGTDLVTVGIGGNDLGLFAGAARLGAAGQAGHADRTGPIGRRVTRALHLVHRVAPRARVVLVGYPRLVQPGSTCPALGFDAAAVDAAHAVQRRLDAALRKAARRSGATYVEVFTASRGHDICADLPWVNGRSADRTRAAPFHPLPRGMRAIARLVERALDAPSSSP